MEAEAEKRRCKVNSDDTAGKGKMCHLLLKHCCSLSISNPFFPPPPQPLSQEVSTTSEEYISCLCDHVWLYEYLLMSFSMLSIYLTAFLAVRHAAYGSRNACQSCTFSIMMMKLTREPCITQLKWQETRLIKAPLSSILQYRPHPHLFMSAGPDPLEENITFRLLSRHFNAHKSQLIRLHLKDMSHEDERT